jgi:hypothetical protein
MSCAKVAGRVSAPMVRRTCGAELPACATTVQPTSLADRTGRDTLAEDLGIPAPERLQCGGSLRRDADATHPSPDAAGQ